MNKKISTSFAIIIILLIAGFLTWTLLLQNCGNNEVYESTGNKKNESIKDKADTSSWNIYKNIKYGYELKFPSSWFANDKILNKVSFSVSQEKGSLALEVSVFPVGENYNIDELIKKSLPDEVKSGRRIQKEEIMIDGEKGYSVMDCGKFECVTQKWAVVKNGKFYFINSKNGLMPEFEKIFATFKFL